MEVDERAIKDLEVECEQQMLDAYFQTLDLSAAMAEKKRFEDRIMQLAELERQRQAKAQKATDEQRKLEASKPEKQGDFVKAKTRPQPIEKITEIEELEMIDIRVFVTPEQKREFKQFLIQQKIKFVPVPKGDSKKWQSKTA